MNIRLRHGGFSLLEVLISTVVLSVGVLGIAAMQFTSSLYSDSGLHRSQASSLAREIVERMKVNIEEAKTGSYDIATLPALYTDCSSVSAVCSPAEMREHDLRVWSSRVAGVLPGGDAAIATVQPADPAAEPVDITVTLTWDQSRGQRSSISEAFTFQLYGLDR